MAGEILIYNRTRISLEVLKDMARAAARFVELPKRARVHMTVSWSKCASGNCRYGMNRRDTYVRIRLRGGKSKAVTGIERGFEVFGVMVHELFHASEFYAGVLKPEENRKVSRRMRWSDRPHEQRAVSREGGSLFVVLGSKEGAEARRAIKAFARELYSAGVVIA